ncbi:MAG: hypothetical protein RIC56_11665 [Pseudomonadales bacterium]
MILELQQAREIAQAQLVADQFSLRESQRNALLGENPANSIAKACRSPGDLTDEDIEILHAFYHGLLAEPLRVDSIRTRSDFYQNEEIQRMTAVHFRTILGTPYGRYWWERISGLYEQINPTLAAVGSETMRELGNEEFGCSSYPDGYRKLLVGKESNP